MARSVFSRLFSLSKTKFPTPISNPNPNPNPNLFVSLSRSISSLPRSRSNRNPRLSPFRRSRPPTPLESEFKNWTSLLRPGFTPADLEHALRSQSDPDFALDLFRWSSLTPNYRHPPSTYFTILHILLSSNRFPAAETLLFDIIAGACPPDLALYNLLLHFCSIRHRLFSTAFDIYKKMLKLNSPACRPDLHTYTMLIQMLLKRFGKPPISYIHLDGIRSLVRQMKASGIIMDRFTLNGVIKAYSVCHRMEDAVSVFREMGLYNCEPNEFTYGCIVKGLCEVGRVDDAIRYYKEMRAKGLMPTGSVCATVVCTLAMERRFKEGKEALMDMLENRRKLDLLTYRTLLEEMCRDGKEDEAFELLEELANRKGAVNQTMYTDLLDGLHWIKRRF